MPEKGTAHMSVPFKRYNSTKFSSVSFVKKRLKNAINYVNFLPLIYFGPGHLGCVYRRQNDSIDFFTDIAAAGCAGALSLRMAFFMAEKRFFSTWLNPVWKYIC